jgi:hypothetical protein
MGAFQARLPLLSWINVIPPTMNVVYSE